MTKQQEIVEKIENIISDKGYYFPYAEATLDILSYLNSRDVVIRERIGSDIQGTALFAFEPLVDDGSWKG